MAIESCHPRPSPKNSSDTRQPGLSSQVRYEISLFCEEFIAKGPPARILAFHATLILDADDELKAHRSALDALATDAQLNALATNPPTVELDSITELPSNATPHGPILCFFQLPLAGS